MTNAKLTYAETQKIAAKFGRSFGEKQHGVIRQIKRVIQLCGVEFAQKMYDAAMEIEANGGMMLADNSRRRTPGGVFFHLVRNNVDDEKRRFIIHGGSRPAFLLLSWQDRIALLQSLQNEQGTADIMKVTLRGRPGQVEKRPEVVVTTMTYQPQNIAFPTGMPVPPTTPTLYVVYIAVKQWEKIEESIANPDDTLIVDGVCAFDPDTKSMAVFATSVQSVLMEEQTRAAQSAADKTPKESNA